MDHERLCCFVRWSGTWYRWDVHTFQTSVGDGCIDYGVRRNNILLVSVQQRIGIIMKMKIIISALSIIAILLMFSGKFITIGHVESNERDADSFSEISLILGVFAGAIMIFVAFWTFRIHIVAGIIPFGVGFSILMICSYLLWCKSL